MKKIFDLLIINANELITAEGASKKPKIKKALNDLGIIKNGAIGIKNGGIVAVGRTKNILKKPCSAKRIINAKGKIVMPGFVDCHTHLVFGGSRENEFVEKIKGADYLQILRKGGGILNTVKKTREELKNPQKLIKKSLEILKKMMAYGTTTAEVKTGYGLNLETEIKLLEIIKRLNKIQPIDLIPTFLGAHAVPQEYSTRKKGYLNLVLEMLSKVKNLSEYCDVFCEKKVFSARETRKILEKAKSIGLKLKLHTDEFSDIGGIELGIELKATSLDHLDNIPERKIEKLAKSKIIGVLLPGVPFHLMTGKYAPARKIIEAGVPVVLASDFNPGSSPTFSMQMIIALACRMMKMTPAEAINATTINAAHAISRAKEIGSLEIGKKADIAILGIPNHEQLPYWFGINLVERVIKNGKIMKS